MIRQNQDASLHEGTSREFSGIAPPKAYCLITTYGLDGPGVKPACVGSTLRRRQGDAFNEQTRDVTRRA